MRWRTRSSTMRIWGIREIGRRRRPLSPTVLEFPRNRRLSLLRGFSGRYDSAAARRGPEAIIDRARDAPVRLCQRYRKRAARGKNANIAVVVVAHELAGFIWDIAWLAMALALPRSAQPA